MIKEYEILVDDKLRPELKLLTIYDKDNNEPIFGILDIVKTLNNNIHLCDLSNERGYIAAFDSNECLIGCYLISKGSESQCQVHLKQVVTFLLLSGAKSFIYFHNHPSNIASASDSDYFCNKMITEAVEHLGIEFTGSYVVTKDGVYSYLNNENTFYPYYGKEEV